MAYTLVRGGALIGLRLCSTCKDNYYEQDLTNRPKCQICDHVIMDGISVTICRICSLETCVCQQCGSPVASDDEKLKEKKNRKRREKDGAKVNLCTTDNSSRKENKEDPGVVKDRDIKTS